MTRDPVDIDLDNYLRAEEALERLNYLQLQEQGMTKNEAIEATKQYLFSQDWKVQELAEDIYEQCWFYDLVCALIGANSEQLEQVAKLAQKLFRQRLERAAEEVLENESGIAPNDIAPPRDISVNISNIKEASILGPYL